MMNHEESPDFSASPWRSQWNDTSLFSLYIESDEFDLLSCETTMNTKACSNVLCHSLVYAGLTVGVTLTVILLIIGIDRLIQRRKNKKLNRVFEGPEQHPWTAFSISSVVNYAALDEKV